MKDLTDIKWTNWSVYLTYFLTVSVGSLLFLLIHYMVSCTNSGGTLRKD